MKVKKNSVNIIILIFIIITNRTLKGGASCEIKVFCIFFIASKIYLLF